MERPNPKSALYLMECVFETDTSRNLIQRDLGGETVTDGVVTLVQDLIIKLAIDQVRAVFSFQTKWRNLSSLFDSYYWKYNIFLPQISCREHRRMQANAAASAGEGMALLTFLAKQILWEETLNTVHAVLICSTYSYGKINLPAWHVSRRIIYEITVWETN